MKKNRLGFTFIEILIAVAILSIISVFAISWFARNFDIQSLNEELVFFQDTLKNLDKNIGKNITDYEFFIHTWEIYHYTVNKSYLQSYQEILGFNSYTGSIKTATGSEVSHIFSDNILIFSHTGSQIYEYDFSSRNHYKIETLNTWKNLNSLYISHYVNIDSRNKIYLVKIENNGNSLTGVIIKNNIGQKRQFLTEDKIQISWKINLIFEDMKWITTSITLTP